MNEGILVAVITAIAFVAMGVYLATYGRKIRYPKGKRVTFQAMGVNVMVIGGNPGLMREGRIQTALGAAHDTWQEMLGLGRGLSEDVPSLVIHYAPEVYHGLHGVQTFAKARIGGKRIPMLVINEKYEPTIISDGVLIHELSHLFAISLLGHPDTHHKNEQVKEFEVLASEKYAAAVGLK